MKTNRLIIPEGTDPAAIRIGHSNYLGYFFNSDLYFTRRLNITDSLSRNLCKNCKFALDFDAKIIEIYEWISNVLIEDILCLIRKLIHHHKSEIFIQQLHIEDIDISIYDNGIRYILFNYQETTYLSYILNDMNNDKNTILSYLLNRKIICLDVNYILNPKIDIIPSGVSESLQSEREFSRIEAEKGINFIREILGTINMSKEKISKLVLNKGYISINSLHYLGLFNREVIYDSTVGYSQVSLQEHIFPTIDRFIPSVRQLVENCLKSLNFNISDANNKIKSIYKNENGCKLCSRSISFRGCLLRKIPDESKFKYIKTPHNSIYKECKRKNKKYLLNYVNLKDIGIFINTSENYFYTRNYIFLFRRVKYNEVWEIHNCCLGNTYRNGSICWGDIPESILIRIDKEPNSLQNFFSLYLESTFSMDIYGNHIYLENDKYLTDDLLIHNDVDKAETIIASDNISIPSDLGIIGFSYNNSNYEYIYE